MAKVNVKATQEFFDRANQSLRKEGQEFLLRDNDVLKKYEDEGLVERVEQKEKPLIKGAKGKNFNAGPATKSGKTVKDGDGEDPVEKVNKK